MEEEKKQDVTEQTQPEQTQEPQPEQPQPEQQAADPAAEEASLKARVGELEKQLAEAKDTLLRTAAEYDNFRKRSAREHDAAFGNGVSHAVNLLLPVLDTLSYAAAAPTEDESYKKGVLMTMGKANDAFAAMGVKEIEAVGKPFDPQIATAVMQREAPEGVESGTVLEVLQKGYLLGDKVVRHATVVVAE